MSGHGDVADDLLQETFFRFMLSGQAHLSHADARPYLFRIATNLLNDRWRRQEGGDAATEEPAGGDDAIDDVLDLSQTLAVMKPRERQLLWLAYIEGMSHREIASVTGLNALSVRVLLLRARKHAARLLAPEVNDGDD